MVPNSCPIVVRSRPKRGCSTVVLRKSCFLVFYGDHGDDSTSFSLAGLVHPLSSLFRRMAAHGRGNRPVLVYDDRGVSTAGRSCAGRLRSTVRTIRRWRKSSVNATVCPPQKCQRRAPCFAYPKLFAVVARFPAFLTRGPAHLRPHPRLRRRHGAAVLCGELRHLDLFICRS